MTKAARGLMGVHLLAWLQPAWTQTAPGPSSDVHAAAILMQAGWATHVGWDAATDACSWKGISCNASLVTAM